AYKTVVQAAVGLMILRHNANQGPFEGKQTDLREQLEKVCLDNGLVCGGWLGGNHFTEFLRNLTTDFKAQNLGYSYHRNGLMRKHTLAWIDPAKIPDWEVNVTRGDAINKGLASPGAEEDIDLI